LISELEAQKRAALRKRDQALAPQRQLELVEAEIADLDAQLEQARQQEARAVILARLAELASAGAAALQDIQAAQQSFDAAIAPLLAAYTTARERQATVRSAFYQTLAELTPEARKRIGDQTASQAILAELETTGADLAGVLAALDGRDLPLDRPITSKHLFSGALHTALREQHVLSGGHLPPPN
jgi:hypothetical protein